MFTAVLIAGILFLFFLSYLAFSRAADGGPHRLLMLAISAILAIGAWTVARVVGLLNQT